MGAAIYARVSTRDKGQDNENQLRELRAFAERLGYTVYKEYTDQDVIKVIPLSKELCS